MTRDWKTIAESLGILAVVVSLIFLALEVRQNSQIGRAEIANTTIQTYSQIREPLLAQSDVWVRGCMGEELSDAERATFAHIFRVHTLYLYWFWVTSEDSILEFDRTHSVYAYAANYHRFPGFAAMSDSQAEWFKNIDSNSPENVNDFVNAVSERIVFLREIEPNPQFDPAFCAI